MNIETVPCETCGTPTPMTATKRCNSCWEVESRLRLYLVDGGAKAREFVLDTVAKYGHRK